MKASIFSALLATAGFAVAQANLPPSVTSSTFLGLSTDPAFNPGIRRDGGGGALVNGQQFVVFSDTLIENTIDFVHNSAAYMGVNDPNDPSKLFDFGNLDQPSGQKTFPGPVFAAVTPDETDLGSDFAIWPNSQFVPYNDTHGMGFLQCVNVTSGAPNGGSLYTTLGLIEIQSPPPTSGTVVLTGTRPVPVAFNHGAVPYGAAGLYRDESASLLYMFGASANTGGMKVARVGFDDILNTQNYSYWTGSEWSATPPAPDDASADIFNVGPQIDTAEVFFSQHFQSIVCVYRSLLVGGFGLVYATSSSITGSWSSPQDLYDVPASANGDECNEGYIYSGHAYPDWDSTGETLLLSWATCAAYIYYAQVSFA